MRKVHRHSVYTICCTVGLLTPIGACIGTHFDGPIQLNESVYGLRECDEITLFTTERAMFIRRSN